jgi:CDP-6-deoxy-D-xylo-4-hexulose-3-dehydrase
MRKIALAEDTISSDDIAALVEWLKTNPRLTKGDLTEQFEEEFARYIGTKYSVFVNSGSSALLLMFASLIASGKIAPNATIAVPNVSWSTDASSVLNNGLNLVFVDCNLSDLSVDIDALEETFKKHNVSALLLVQVLGLVPIMDTIKSLCDKYGVLLLEDTCESMGSEYAGQMLGSFGFASVFSTYFGHHISTIEGGFICTNDSTLYNVMKSQRSHGWDRDLTAEFRDNLRTKNQVDPWKARYTFYYPSYNLRSTDLQAFIGLGQMSKLKEIHRIREENYRTFIGNLPGKMWKPISHGFTSNFAYPMIDKNRDKIVANLEAAGVETRPLICGDMAVQPYILDHRSLANVGSPRGLNAMLVDDSGFYVPNHAKLTEEEVIEICQIIRKSL